MVAHYGWIIELSLLMLKVAWAIHRYLLRINSHLSICMSPLLLRLYNSLLFIIINLNLVMKLTVMWWAWLNHVKICSLGVALKQLLCILILHLAILLLTSHYQALIVQRVTSLMVLGRGFFSTGILLSWFGSLMPCLWLVIYQVPKGLLPLILTLIIMLLHKLLHLSLRNYNKNNCSSYREHTELILRHLRNI